MKLKSIREQIDKIGTPIYNACEIMHKVRDLGVTIIINSCRGDKKELKEFLDENDIPYDSINENPNQPEGTSNKIMADRYWDNRQPSWRGLQYAYEELVRYVNRSGKPAKMIVVAVDVDGTLARE